MNNKPIINSFLLRVHKYVRGWIEHQANPQVLIYTINTIWDLLEAEKAYLVYTTQELHAQIQEVLSS